jgi:hypothetical protein
VLLVSHDAAATPAAPPSLPPPPPPPVGTHFPSCYKCSWEIGPDNWIQLSGPIIRPDFPAAFVARWKMRSQKNHLGGRGLMVPGFALALSRGHAAQRSGACGSALGLWGSGSNTACGLAGSGETGHARDAAGGWSRQTLCALKPTTTGFRGNALSIVLQMRKPRGLWLAYPLRCRGY